MPSGGMQQSQTMSLQQVLAPQLQQSLAILQAPLLELRSLIQQEMEMNPVLEEEDMRTEEGVEEGVSDPVLEDDGFDEEFAELAKLDDEWREYLAQSNAYSARSEEDEERRQHFFESQTTSETLQQHLLAQLGSTDLNEQQRKVAELVIGNIDDNGYLTSSVEEMAASTGIDERDLVHVLGVIQSFHPPGVGALDLRECLLIQLQRLGRQGTLEWKIIDRHLDLLAKRKFPELARRLGTTVRHVQRAAEVIATLSPRPGQIFSADPQNYVLPDVTIEKIEGVYTISLNGEGIPHLRISNVYKDLMSQANSANGTREYVREKIRSGKFLIKSIHQRQQTILSISKEILNRQMEFFEHGPSHLKPMTMSQVAEAVGVHETTVSRAISGKYMATPHGIFEMKYFFTTGYQTGDGEVVSNTSVKEAIAELVRNEDPERPLSDQEIVEILEGRGIPIARRTVAKYRGELGILPSNMRRKY